ncbi:transposase [Bradyrhizobium sp. JYMT SZCCT0428]|uniref:IS66 family transposase n=1 Tax=Bradyrhizobium sp. JYMT SZCCT0428 TaxID=2807673 RepID=UPI00289EC9D0|nr:transposase [Bradyrhizobium sp. JYMT SZCCT0428]
MRDRAYHKRSERRRRKADRQELSATRDRSGSLACALSASSSRAATMFAKAMNYMLKRWSAFTASSMTAASLSKNAAERDARGIAFVRKSWLFCGSDRGGELAALMYRQDE